MSPENKRFFGWAIAITVLIALTAIVIVTFFL